MCIAAWMVGPVTFWVGDCGSVGDWVTGLAGGAVLQAMTGATAVPPWLAWHLRPRARAVTGARAVPAAGLAPGPAAHQSGQRAQHAGEEPIAWNVQERHAAGSVFGGHRCPSVQRQDWGERRRFRTCRRATRLLQLPGSSLQRRVLRLAVLLSCPPVLWGMHVNAHGRVYGVCTAAAPGRWHVHMNAGGGWPGRMLSFFGRVVTPLALHLPGAVGPFCLRPPRLLPAVCQRLRESCRDGGRQPASRPPPAACHKPGGLHAGARLAAVTQTEALCVLG